MSDQLVMRCGISRALGQGDGVGRDVDIGARSERPSHGFAICLLLEDFGNVVGLG